MQVPSGQTFSELDIQLMRHLHSVGFIKWSESPFTLKSGIKSHVYVFGREDITDNPRVLAHVGRKIAAVVHELADHRQPCVIGIPTAGTALAVGTSVYNESARHYVGQRGIACRIMREIKKSHGAHTTWVVGKPEHEKQQYFVLDNVVTDGGSKFEAAKKLKEDGYQLEDLHFLTFVDRQQGAMAKLVAHGLKTTAIYNILDIAHAFKVLRLWPEEAERRVEDEIREHQLGLA